MGKDVMFKVLAEISIRYLGIMVLIVAKYGSDSDQFFNVMKKINPNQDMKLLRKIADLTETSLKLAAKDPQSTRLKRIQRELLELAWDVEAKRSAPYWGLRVSDARTLIEEMYVLGTKLGSRNPQKYSQRAELVKLSEDNLRVTFSYLLEGKDVLSEFRRYAERKLRDK